MNRQISFQLPGNLQLTDKIITYFTRSAFKFKGIKDDKLEFIQTASLFDTWTSNPLKWGSEIIVSINNNKVMADFFIDSGSQMNTVEEEKVWNTFIENFKLYMTDNKQLIGINEMILTDVKRSRIFYIGWSILGALTGGFVGVLISNLTGSKIFGYFTIPIMASLFLTNCIRYRKEKNAV